MHLRDFRGKTQAPLGTGDLDLGPLTAAVRKAGWSGCLLAEEERPDPKDKPGDSATGPARQALRRTFGI